MNKPLIKITKKIIEFLCEIDVRIDYDVAEFHDHSDALYWKLKNSKWVTFSETEIALIQSTGIFAKLVEEIVFYRS